MYNIYIILRIRRWPRPERRHRVKRCVRQSCFFFFYTYYIFHFSLIGSFSIYSTYYSRRFSGTTFYYIAACNTIIICPAMWCNVSNDVPGGNTSRCFFFFYPTYRKKRQFVRNVERSYCLWLG